MKEGIFGGTFDPPHIGHLIAAESARRALELDRIRFIPAAVPPHKRGRTDITPAPVRLEMVKRAVAGNPGFLVDDQELKRKGPSYTVDTIQQLCTEFPSTEFTLLIGMDNLADFPAWKEPERIRSLAKVVVLSRPAVEKPPRKREGFRLVTIPLIEVSSSSIRQMVRQGRSIRYLVPERVVEVIVRERLYGYSPA